MGFLVSSGLAAGRLGQPPQALGQTTAVLRRQLVELDSHACGRLVVPAPGDPRHATPGGQVSPVASGISRARVSPPRTKGRSARRRRPRTNRPCRAGSQLRPGCRQRVRPRAGAHLDGKTAACRVARAKSRTQVHHRGGAHLHGNARGWRSGPDHAASRHTASSETGTPPAASRHPRQKVV